MNPSNCKKKRKGTKIVPGVSLSPDEYMAIFGTDGKRRDIANKRTKVSPSSSNLTPPSASKKTLTTEKTQPATSATSSRVTPAVQMYAIPATFNNDYFDPTTPHFESFKLCRVIRPFDEDDDGSESYLSKTEESVYYYRGALLHYLSHFEQVDEETKKARKLRMQKRKEESRLRMMVAQFGRRLKEDDDEDTSPNYFYPHWQAMIRQAMPISPPDDEYAKAKLRLNLVNCVCKTNFHIEEVRSNWHSVPCEDCSEGFWLSDDDSESPNFYALEDSDRFSREKICMKCVKFRSDMFLRLTDDKRSLRKINQVLLELHLILGILNGNWVLVRGIVRNLATCMVGTAFSTRD